MLEALGEFDDPEVKKAVIEIAQNNDYPLDIRKKSIDNLAAFNDPSVVENTLPMLEIRDNYILYDNIIRMVNDLGEAEKNAELVRRMAFRAHYKELNLNKIIVLVILFSFAFAVDTKAKIKEDFTLTGFIQKQDGSGVKGAKISIYNDQDKEIADGKSKRDGEFKIKRKLKVGNYLLIAEHKKEGRGESEFEITNNDLDLIVIILNENEEDTAQESDTLTALKEELKELPKQKRPEEKDQLKFESTFFEYENSLAALKAEIDSLKTVVKGMRRNKLCLM